MKTSTSRKPIPHAFVLEELQDLSPITKPMFGCIAIYVSGKIVLILRDRESSPRDNGIWLATTEEHHASLKKDFPSMRSIGVLGEGVTGWQNLPQDQEDFEDATLKACELVRRGDPRIGKVPKAKSPKRAPRKTTGPKKTTGTRKTVGFRKNKVKKKTRD